MESGKEPTAVVPARLNALQGTLTDRVTAFDQIAGNIATLQLNGWDNVQKCKAACWLADAAGVHPAIWMQNHYAMVMKGKLIIEPKWEFTIAMLQSRVAGFQFEILREDENGAKVQMSAPGLSTQVYEYTLDMARRQGLLSRDNAWGSNPAEMCFKQAVKRCAKRFSAAALMDMSMGFDGIEVAEPAEPTPTPAQELERAAQAASKRPEAQEVPFQEIGAPAAPEEASQAPKEPPPPRSPKQRLHDALLRHYKGAMSRSDAAEKTTFLYNEMKKEKTGTDPKMVFKKGEIGPVEAAELADWLEARMARKEAVKAEPEPEPAEPEEDTPPPSEEAAPEPEPELTPGAAYDQLMGTVLRARRVMGRVFVNEYPLGSGKFWFMDRTALMSANGNATSVLLQKGGEVVMPIDKLVQLDRIVAEECDAKERNGR